MSNSVNRPITRQASKKSELSHHADESEVTINTNNFINEPHEEWPKWTIEQKEEDD